MSSTTTLTSNPKIRHIKASAFKFLTVLCIVMILGAFAGLLGSIIHKALPLMWIEEVAIQVEEPSLAQASGVYQHASAFGGDDRGASPGGDNPVPRKITPDVAQTILEDALGRSLSGSASSPTVEEVLKVLSRKSWDVVAKSLGESKGAPRYRNGETSPSGPDNVTAALPGEGGIQLWLPLRYGRALATPGQAMWLEAKKEQGAYRRVFNWGFFTQTDSLSPERAGIAGAFLGTLYVLLIALGVAFPLGLGAAVYLELFSDASRRFTQFLTVNIANLAAVPSIIFGLVGLTLFIGLGGMTRSSALVGGLTLSLMMLPLVIVSSRLSLSQVPPALKEAALGLGASPFQAVFHLVVPVAMPGIITGTLLCIARMIGESAPLLMVGMVIFSSHLPSSVTDATTVLPVLIYQWFQRPEPGFIEASSGAIVALLTFLLFINSLALLIRKKFEKLA